MIKNGTLSRKFKKGTLLMFSLIMGLAVCVVFPLSANADPKLIVKDSGGEKNVFVVSDDAIIEAANENTNAQMILKVASSVGGAPQFFGMRSGGTLSSPTSTPVGKNIFSLGAIGYGTSAWSGFQTGLIGFWATENFTNTAMGTEMRFFTTPNGSNTRAERMRITQNGRVGIGVPTPEFLLQLAGGAYSNGTTWVNASSREYKENINTLSAEAALETLTGLTPVTFVYKDDQEGNHVGFIAEDVPELVATRDRKGLSSMDIVAVLTKVVQEQQKTIADLNAKVEELSREVKLKNGFASLETK